jgi:hypothetical protein
MENTKIKLTVGELYALHTELEGAEKNPGLVSQKLTMMTKYNLGKLVKLSAERKQLFEKTRQELVQSIGTDDGKGNFSIPQTETDADGNITIHPSFIKFRDEINEVLNTEEEIEIPAFKIEDFADVQTEGYYPVFFKILGL